MFQNKFKIFSKKFLVLKNACTFAAQWKTKLLTNGFIYKLEKPFFEKGSKDNKINELNVSFLVYMKSGMMKNKLKKDYKKLVETKNDCIFAPP